MRARGHARRAPVSACSRRSSEHVVRCFQSAAMHLYPLPQVALPILTQRAAVVTHRQHRTPRLNRYGPTCLNAPLVSSVYTQCSARSGPSSPCQHSVHRLVEESSIDITNNTQVERDVTATARAIRIVCRQTSDPQGTPQPHGVGAGAVFEASQLEAVSVLVLFKGSSFHIEWNAAGSLQRRYRHPRRN